MTKLIVLFLLLPFMFVCTLFINPRKEYDKNSRFFRKMLYGYTWLALMVCRIKVHTEGMEKVPKNTRFVLVGNHRSNWDPIITWFMFRQYDIAFLSKESNFKIPLFGKIVRKCCFMKIDRENPRNALKTIEKASELIKQDEVSIGVYPEGTRNKENSELLPFHNSVFKIAKKANVPIVVVSLDGADKIYKRTPWRMTHVYMNVCDVIEAEDVTSLRTAEIGERVKNQIEKSIQKKEEKKDETNLHTV